MDSSSLWIILVLGLAGWFLVVFFRGNAQKSSKNLLPSNRVEQKNLEQLLEESVLVRQDLEELLAEATRISQNIVNDLSDQKKLRETAPQQSGFYIDQQDQELLNESPKPNFTGYTRNSIRKKVPTPKAQAEEVPLGAPKQNSGGVVIAPVQWQQFTPISDKDFDYLPFEEICRLAESGFSVFDIAQKLNIGQGEVQLVLSVYQKQAQA